MINSPSDSKLNGSIDGNETFPQGSPNVNDTVHSSSSATSNSISSLKTSNSQPFAQTTTQQSRPNEVSLLQRSEIKKVMDSDVAINALLSRLKQSLLTCEEFTKFIRKKYIFEEEHTQELSKQYKHFFTTASQSSSLIFVRKPIHDVLAFDGKLSVVKESYVKALQKMYDEISALLLTMTKMRKSVKEHSRRLEKDVSDAIHSAEKAQNRYTSLCQDWDKLRMTDPTKTKLTLRGSKTTKEQEEELLRKIDSADLEYKQKVDHSNSLRTTFIIRERPKIVSELKDLILEIDTAMTIQLQKYTIWTENLILNSGVSISPLDSNKSMKAVASSVKNEKDLYDFLNKYNHAGKNSLLVNRNLIPVNYKKYPSMMKHNNKANKSPPKFAVDPSRNSIPKRVISTHNETPFQDTPQAKSSIMTDPTITAGATLASTSISSPSSQPYTSPASSTYTTPQSKQNIFNSNQQLPSTPSHSGVNAVDRVASNQSSVDQRFQSLDPGNQTARLPSMSTTVDSMATSMSDRPISHIQADAAMPHGVNNNFKTFGVPLESLIEYEQDMVPAIVRQCIYVIDTYGLDLEGIYRKSANVLDVSKLREDIDKDPSNVSMILPSKNFHDTDIYLVGSLLKAFFSSLPDTLLPKSIAEEVKICCAIDDPKTRKNYMHGLIYKLPDAQYWTLRALLFHLKRILEHESKNRMNLKGLCIIWGPTIIPPNVDDEHDVNYQIRSMETLLSVADQAFEPE
ncbi:GTPase-activating protein RGD1 NDAI_0B04640 [Naumovozyma dairenensis CBS 421]|uniref:Rho-GAP domain-containing protein n=1 Tax=Naumovozyma dairenensis (strain ATCC 10597 / BCRC 20456 / CBS 421 / NBRC 0211 / NRRL Y-12639) TaxID=1071378 RepID=G0W6T8_NAUDC|nr:hypothetical protein NDAI_0B04640 [Naumovozyma dairenensis CBS 421]CCD23499.1 hypothetical protein NDAI_0B04640 [Naumovozyma dairenensis CBS 421]